MSKGTTISTNELHAAIFIEVLPALFQAAIRQLSALEYSVSQYVYNKKSHLQKSVFCKIQPPTPRSLSPEWGKGIRCATVISCPPRGKDIRRTGRGLHPTISAFARASKEYQFEGQENRNAVITTITQKTRLFLMALGPTFDSLR
jgi:hypothetical protein